MPNSKQEVMSGILPADGSSPDTELHELVFELEVPGRLPSWNEILGMEQWARYKFKKELSDVFLSTLRATANDCSIRTICAPSTLLTYADTLESYLRMRQAQRKSKSLRKRLDQKNPREPELKSTESEKVPF